MEIPTKGADYACGTQTGIICLCPVAVYPKSHVDDLLNEVNSIKADISQGKKPVFDNIDSLFEELNK